VGIYEVMPMLEDIQRVILKGGNALEISDVARAAGINDLRASALLKVKHGLTSLTEIDRVTTD
jgi:type IV pilus assembly protein PilB